MVTWSTIEKHPESREQNRNKTYSTEASQKKNLLRPIASYNFPYKNVDSSKLCPCGKYPLDGKPIVIIIVAHIIVIVIVTFFIGIK